LVAKWLPRGAIGGDVTDAQRKVLWVALLILAVPVGFVVTFVLGQAVRLRDPEGFVIWGTISAVIVVAALFVRAGGTKSKLSGERS
jgi:hypothetical protein